MAEGRGRKPPIERWECAWCHGRVNFNGVSGRTCEEARRSLGAICRERDCGGCVVLLDAAYHREQVAAGTDGVRMKAKIGRYGRKVSA